MPIFITNMVKIGILLPSFFFGFIFFLVELELREEKLKKRMYTNDEY